VEHYAVMRSPYSGALIAQVGKLCFVLAAGVPHNDMITEFG
jgi:hypothetical protein